ncbi:MAG: shikimate dehydrogenase [Gammaproteobacteria bacterium]|nr:shikimate dehydrogenase [Gammaproteobacteria bacterium]
MDRYLVLGNPIEHSLSPDIHRQFASQTDQEIEYDRRLIEVGEFTDALRSMREEGIAGANVTVPFKEIAFAAANEASPRALKAGAANTLVFRQDGSIYADNTDGAGLVNDIKLNHQRQIKDKRLLILGAGGAVRGVLKPLIDEAPASITIANRTIEKAELLRDIHADEFPIKVSTFGALEGQQFDMVINGTSLGLQGKVAPLPPGIFAESALAYDMMYGDGSLPFQEWARNQGAELVLDGLGMLVGQAAESFYIWRGVRPDPVAVIEHMRSS